MFELKKLFDKYFMYGGDIIPMGNSQDILIDIKDCITKGIIDRDNPDGYYKISNDEILIMEHFCFDSSTKIKGSEACAEFARIERENKTHDVINCSININNYWNNLKEYFNRHYSKIDKYKHNLFLEGIADENTKFKIAFFIEDITPLGNIDKNTNKRIHALFCDKFIDLFESYENIDYIFDFSEVNSNKKVLFTTRKDIKALRSNEIKIEDIELINWKPQVRSFSVEIPT